MSDTSPVPKRQVYLERLSLFNRVSKGLRHNIVGNVVGGLVLAFVLWILRALFPPMLLWAKGVFVTAIDFFVSVHAFPLWFVFVLSVGWFLFMVTKGPLPKWSKPEAPVPRSSELGSEGKQQFHPQLPQLNEFETNIIAVLASADGVKLTDQEIINSLQISTNHLRISQALESLIGKGLVRVARNYVYGNSYLLSPNGRDLAIYLEFA